MSKKETIIIILFLGFLIRLFLAPFGTLSLDFNTFLAWSNILHEGGFARFYNGWSDYLPGYMYVLWFLGFVKGELDLQGEALQILYKLPVILADIGTGYLIYNLLVKKFPKGALLASLMYIFNPAVIANSTLWGQVDGLIPFFVLFALSLVDNPALSGVSLAIGTLIKPQAAFAFPIFAYQYIKNKEWKQLGIFCVCATVLFTLAFVPFIGAREPVHFFLERFSVSANQYPYSSINAFNFWALLVGMWQPDQIWYGIGFLLAGVFIVASFIPLLKRKIQNTGSIYLVLTIIFLATFNFLTRIHERHLLPAFAPLALSAVYLPFLWWVYALISLTYVANLYYSYIWISQNFQEVFPKIIISLFSFLNFAALIYVFLMHSNQKLALKTNLAKLWSFPKDKVANISEIKVIAQNKNIILSGILFFALITRLINITNPAEFYFDEVYHAFTAREVVRGNPAAWEFGATPPEGFAYEWTHPPFAKLAMAGGMTILGENPIGWRLAGILFGVGTIYLIYLLTKSIFKNETLALLSAALLSLDGMDLVMSRIGMNDIYFLFFALLTIYFFLKDRNFLSALSLGLALSSKWTAVYLVPILAVAWLLYKRNFKFNYLWFLILPSVLYFVSYTIFFSSGHSLQEWWETQKQMWWYHTGLKATHPFSSPWWSWPLMLKPVWLYIKEMGKSVANIYISGNPVIFFAGISAITSSLVTIIRERNKDLLFILVCYLGLFLPWSLSPRIMFLYHYLPSVPFMIILLAYLLYSLWVAKKKFLVTCYLLLVTISFLAYFPLWSAIPMPSWWSGLLF